MIESIYQNPDTLEFYVIMGVIFLYLLGSLTGSIVGVLIFKLLKFIFNEKKS